MTGKQLSPNVSVRPQVDCKEVPDLAAKGVTAIVNNRPDGEGLGQPSSAELAAEAERAGIAYHHIPVVPGRMTPDHINAFAKVLEQHPEGKVVAFCRTGTRSATLWALAEAGNRPVNDILSATRNAGYDIDGMRPFIEARAGMKADG